MNTPLLTIAIPAEAGTHGSKAWAADKWAPAFAGMEPWGKR